MPSLKKKKKKKPFAHLDLSTAGCVFSKELLSVCERRTPLSRIQAPKMNSHCRRYCITSHSPRLLFVDVECTEPPASSRARVACWRSNTNVNEASSWALRQRVAREAHRRRCARASRAAAFFGMVGGRCWSAATSSSYIC